MFDITKITKTVQHCFPSHKYVEYEESDLEWSDKIGYSLIKQISTEVIKNGLVSELVFIPINNIDGQVIEISLTNTTTAMNKNSEYIPKWNPEIIG